VPKRGERAIPPAPPHGWLLLFAEKPVAIGWRDLCNTAPSATYAAWETLTFRPTEPINPARHHRLRHGLARRVIDGQTLEQWQYEVTAGGRIWFCPDPKRRTVWLTYASPRHPKATE
jgi:hypothetical protein